MQEEIELAPQQDERGNGVADRAAGEPPPQERADEDIRPPDRRSALLWLLVIVALMAAVIALLGRPLTAYFLLLGAKPGGQRDSRITALARQGPIGTELARRYAGALFREDRVRGVYFVVKQQALFHALPVETVEKYLGKPDTRVGSFTHYVFGDTYMSVQVKSGVVAAIYHDKAAQPKDEEPPTPPLPAELLSE